VTGMEYQFEYLTVEDARVTVKIEAANIVEATAKFTADPRVGVRPVMAIRVVHVDGMVRTLGERRETAGKPANKKRRAGCAKGR